MLSFQPLCLYIFALSLPTAAAAKSLQSCPNLCNPIDGSPPGSAVLGILQARTLESVAIAFSKLQQPRTVISVAVLVDITIACEAMGQGDNKYERLSKVAAEI